MQTSNGLHKKQNKQLIKNCLVGLYNTIFQKDIVLREKFKDISKLKSVVNFVFDNIGSETSIRNISNSLALDDRKIYPQTVETYLQALSDSYLLYKADRYNIKGKQYLQFNSKYHVADIGLRYALLGAKTGDAVHNFRKHSFFGAVCRGYKISIGKINDLEVDFIAQKFFDEVEYYQVCENINDSKTSKRELKSLQSINDNYPKFLLSKSYSTSTYDGIKYKNVFECLLEG